MKTPHRSAAPSRPLITIVPDPEPPRPDGLAERKFRERFAQIARTFRDGGMSWKERDELRVDLHRAVDVYFANKVTEKSKHGTGGSK